MTAISTQSRSRSPLAIGLLALALVAIAQVPATTAQDPNVFVTKLGTKGLQALSPDIPSVERLAMLRKLFRKNFDLAGIGFFTLGRYRWSASPQEQQQFFALYPEFTIRALNARLGEYGGAPFPAG